MSQDRIVAILLLSLCLPVSARAQLEVRVAGDSIAFGQISNRTAVGGNAEAGEFGFVDHLAKRFGLVGTLAPASLPTLAGVAPTAFADVMRLGCGGSSSEDHRTASPKRCQKGADAGNPCNVNTDCDPFDGSVLCNTGNAGFCVRHCDGGDTPNARCWTDSPACDVGGTCNNLNTQGLTLETAWVAEEVSASTDVFAVKLGTNDASGAFGPEATNPDGYEQFLQSTIDGALARGAQAALALTPLEQTNTACSGTPADRISKLTEYRTRVLAIANADLDDAIYALDTWAIGIDPTSPADYCGNDPTCSSSCLSGNPSNSSQIHPTSAGAEKIAEALFHTIMSLQGSHTSGGSM